MCKVSFVRSSGIIIASVSWLSKMYWHFPLGDHLESYLALECAPGSSLPVICRPHLQSLFQAFSLNRILIYQITSKKKKKRTPERCQGEVKQQDETHCLGELELKLESVCRFRDQKVQIKYANWVKGYSARSKRWHIYFMMNK